MILSTCRASCVVLAIVSCAASAEEVFRLPDGPLPINPTAQAVAPNPLDFLMQREMKKRGAVGAALAVTHGGRLVHARGYGYADLQTLESVRPTSLFRIASVSKTITATAILQLIERRKLSFTDKVTDVLELEPLVNPEQTPDTRIDQVTIWHLLTHSGGWDPEVSFDPMSIDTRVRTARSLGIATVDVRPEHIVRYMLGQPLDFDPGTRYAYCNFEYCVLGRIIEQVSGQSYEEYVKKNVLARLGITQMRIGTCESQPGEVQYYLPRVEDGETREGEYASANEIAGPIDVYESAGGWTASVVDLVKFASDFDNPRRSKVLRFETVTAMFSRPGGSLGLDEMGRPKDRYYGFGWYNIWKEGRQTTCHGGSLRSSKAALYRRPDLVDWAVLFNTPKKEVGSTISAEIQNVIDEML